MGPFSDFPGLQILLITTPIGQWGGADSFIPDSHSLLVEPFIEGKTHSVASSLLCSRSKMWFTRTTTHGMERAGSESGTQNPRRKLGIVSCAYNPSLVVGVGRRRELRRVGRIGPCVFWPADLTQTSASLRDPVSQNKEDKTIQENGISLSVELRPPHNQAHACTCVHA